MAHNFLEQLVAEWYEYQGYFVRRNVLVGKRTAGGHACELDVVAFDPKTRKVVHIEPSMDAQSWAQRTDRDEKKLEAGRKDTPMLFDGLDILDPIEQNAPITCGTRLGENVRTAIDAELRTAVRRSILDNADGQLALTARHIDEYTRDHLVLTLLAAMGNTWWTRSDAVTAASRYLGFRRTGKSIKVAFKSVIIAAIRRGLIERDGSDWIRKAP